MDTAPPTPDRRAWAVPLVTGLILVALAVGLGAWIFVRGNEPFDIDADWNILLAGWSSPVVTGFSQFMNVVGAGWFSIAVVPLGGALLMILLRRPWGALFLVLSLAASAAGVQVLKQTFGRARPEDILVMSDYGSYPSGHAGNAATVATIAVVLFPRLWVGIAGAAWVLLMAFSRTYLHAHWLSDTLGGALLGAGVTLLLAAAFAVPLARERKRRADAAVAPASLL
ncbi:phosphatase PAP2 family protein [Microbacterium sp. ET2]|uniref:phosphatase PAP2 family protein n=1 Tax=Microbacterium albipurpureum TaxID=3050384 RepID=UPI00259CA8EC|nr:phosphatase PAP2 family protein [Microbacterium sp. ET2 (Ac-2212)]WJL96304.1 phosphatase PAP2 family protein [Microbacterium sp. ET2 (Ac-2212)]